MLTFARLNQRNKTSASRHQYRGIRNSRSWSAIRGCPFVLVLVLVLDAAVTSTERSI